MEEIENTLSDTSGVNSNTLSENTETKKIKVYPLHEEERNLVKEMIDDKKITNEKKTASFVMGDMSEKDISTLQSKGVIVKMIEDDPVIQTPGANANMFSSMLKNRIPLKAIRKTRPDRIVNILDASIDSTEPQVYLLKLDAPLLEEYRKSLENEKVKLLEYIPQNNYTAKLTKEQLESLRKLDFVKSITLYSQEDSGPVFSRQAILAPSSDPIRSKEKGKMKTFDIRLHTKDQQDRDKVLEWLSQNNVNIAGSGGRKIRIYLLSDSDLLDKISALPQVEFVEEYILPGLANNIARVLLGKDYPDGHNPATNIEFKGEDQIVGVADTGLDDTHPDFQGRIKGVVALGRPNNYTDTDGHGTHVAGSILGDGTSSNGKYAGVAPKSKLFFQSVMDEEGELRGLPYDLTDLFEEAYQIGARIHNNSWGSIARSYYRMNSLEVDEFVANHRDMLIVIAAGNDGIATGNINSKKGYVDLLSIKSPGTAKNALTVGASRSSRTTGGWSELTYKEVWPDDFPDAPISDEKVSGNPECMAGFSGRGPCRDMRVKPDVVAPGTDILSTKSSRAPLGNFAGIDPNNNQYGYMSGTSMASPLVAGCAALVREYFTKKRNHNPSAALLKATLINGTKQLKGNDSIADIALLPNYHQGFGCIYLPYTIPNNTLPWMKIEYLDTWQNDSLKFNMTGEIIKYSFTLGQSEWLRICLVWTDSPNSGIQNNLNIILDKDDEREKKWISNESWPYNLNDLDSRNNVQVIRIENAKPGKYNINLLTPQLLNPGQDFALVVSGNLTSQLNFEYKEHNPRI